MYSEVKRSAAPLTAISIMIDEDFFCTCTPLVVTACGSCGNARLTRFCTCTCATSGSVSSEKNTVSVSCPVDELLDVMYSMLSTPLICASIGAATDSATVCESAPAYIVLTVTCTGMIVGYCSIGSARIAIRPASTMIVDTTTAKTGRSMKNRENIGLAQRIANASSTRRASLGSAPPTTLPGGTRRRRSGGIPVAISASRTALARCSASVRFLALAPAASA